VIRKEPLGRDAQSRLQHEMAILQRLRGVAGVAQLLDEPRHAEAIVLADAGLTSLAALSKPLPAEDLIALALKLARAVAGMHACGVIHRDIGPANIVIADNATPCLVDFGLATSAAQIRPEFTHPAEILGTLAYLAPEQTGRTGRSVDQRADLYGLGATLYELATGEPPFGTGDPLRLTHDHLARGCRREPSPVSCALSLLGTAQGASRPPWSGKSCADVAFERCPGEHDWWVRVAVDPDFPLVPRACLGTWWWR
jgi:serine/threonine protein kinase